MTGDDATPAEAQDRGPVGAIHFIQDNLAQLMLAIHELPAAGHRRGARRRRRRRARHRARARPPRRQRRRRSSARSSSGSGCRRATSAPATGCRASSGPTIAAELMLTGRRFGADEAMRFGMLNRVVPRDALLDAALELAGLITDNSEYGVYMTKLGMWANLDAPSLRHAMELENRTQVLGTFTRNMTEAGRAFVEKRDPTWNPM